MNKIAKLFGMVALSLALIGVSPVAAAPKKGAKAAEKQKVKTIFDYKEELGLTDEQSTKLKDAVVELQKELQGYKAKTVDAYKELGAKLKEEASLDAIRPLWQKIYNFQVDMRMADIAASRRINGTLKPDQLKKWREIQAKVRSVATSEAEKAAKEAEKAAKESEE